MEIQEVNDLIPVDWHNQRVLIYKQIADSLNCSVDLLRMHFKNRSDQFEEGVHYFKLTGEALRQFRRRVNVVYSGNQHLVSKCASNLILFTYQGVARLSKLIDTPEAWEIFSELERVYFGVLESEIEKAQVVQEELPFAQRYSAAARRSVARDFKESKNNPAPVAPAFAANPELADKLIAIAQLMEPAPARDKILSYAANLLVGERLF